MIPAGSLGEITKSIKSLQINRLQAFLFSDYAKRFNFHKFLVSNPVSSLICKFHSPESLQLINFKKIHKEILTRAELDSALGKLIGIVPEIS